MPDAGGFHARPAAVLAARAKRFAADVRVERGNRTANAKSVVSLMQLEVSRGDAIRLVAIGPDAGEAIRVLASMVASGLGEAAGVPEHEPAVAARAGAAAVVESRDAASASPGWRARSRDASELAGVPASPGVALGQVVQLRRAAIDVHELARDRHVEQKRLDEALEHARAELDALCVRLQAEGDADRAALFTAHAELLDDPSLLDIARAGIAAGRSAAFSWREAFTVQAERLARVRIELLAGRAADLRDVGQRVLRFMAGPVVGPIRVPADAILVAPDLTPSETAAFDGSGVLGFCTVGGGTTSHVAILARALAIPAVVGIDPRVLDVPDGTPALLDATRGLIRLDPSGEEVARFRQLEEREAVRHRAQVEQAQLPALTRDGHRVEVGANAGSVADGARAGALGADAIGLLRTEFLFSGRTSPPSEDEQASIYETIARALGPTRPLTIRMLDVGGDKPLPYLSIPREANPCLGERGVRAMLSRPELMTAQLRAILRAGRVGAVRAMVPMVATLDEWRAVKDRFERERARLGAPEVALGMMIEVPSAAILADQFAPEVDFFSIGTNDLAQYTLAMDRGHPKLATQVDGLHPAVLRLVKTTVEAAHRHGRRVGVCGGIAGDEQGVAILVGLGVDGLSVPIPALPAVKARVRALRRDVCADLAAQALLAATAVEVRALDPSTASSSNRPDPESA